MQVIKTEPLPASLKEIVWCTLRDFGMTSKLRHVRCQTIRRYEVEGRETIRLSIAPFQFVLFPYSEDGAEPVEVVIPLEAGEYEQDIQALPGCPVERFPVQFRQVQLTYRGRPINAETPFV